LTYGDVRPLRSAAELFTVVATGAAQTAERIDADDSTSSDEELEDLAAEVKRFEQLMDRQSAVPGVVPAFDRIPNESMDRIPLELALKQRTLTKEDKLVQQQQQREQAARDDLDADSAVEAFLRETDAAGA